MIRRKPKDPDGQRRRQERLRALRESIRSGDMTAAEALLRSTRERGRGGKGAQGAFDPDEAPPPEPAFDEPFSSGDEGGDEPPASRGPSPGPLDIERIQQATTPQALEQVCPGREIAVPAAPGDGRCWYVRTALSDWKPDLAHVPARYASVLRGMRQQFDELSASPGLCHAANAAPEDLLLAAVDAWKPGPAKAVFLIGTLHYADDDFILEQHLARTASEEPAVLRSFWDRYEKAGVLVTFQGAKTHLPLLRTRTKALGVDEPWSDPPHLDLRPEVRERWKEQLRSFSLPMLERALLGRRRTVGIARQQTGEAYGLFARTGDARFMAAVLGHNRLDLLAMAEIVRLLLTGEDPLL